jgi:hypothetical protein
MIGELVMVTGRTVLLVCLTAVLLAPVSASAQSEEVNKALARRFYEEVWFSRNPAAVDELVAPEYVVHDIGDRKAVREPASEQKRTADLFWQNGEMSGRIDFQIAEGRSGGHALAMGLPAPTPAHETHDDRRPESDSDYQHFSLQGRQDR